MSKELDIKKECCDIWNKLKDKTKMINYLIESKLQIADLEAKLAESENEIKTLICDYESRITKEQELMSWLEHNNEELKQQLAELSKYHEWVSEFLERYKIDSDSTPEYSKNPMIEYCEQVYDFRLCDNVEIKDLQEQLEEYKKDNEQLEDRLHTAEQETLHFQNKYFDMQWQLAEKRKELLEIKQRIAEKASKEFQEMIDKRETHNQDKISFAVEQLEKLKEFCEKELKECDKLLKTEFEDDFYIQSVMARETMCFDFRRIIDNQINVLRNNKDGIH